MLTVYAIVCRNGDFMWAHDKTFTTEAEAIQYASHSISNSVLWKVCPIKVDIFNEKNFSDTLIGWNKSIWIEILYDTRYLGASYVVSPFYAKYYAYPTEEAVVDNIKEEVANRIHQGFEMLSDEHTVKDHYVKMVREGTQYQLVVQNVHLPNNAVVWG